jgi:quercetin dioxygenase-like cupin family protein
VRRVVLLLSVVFVATSSAGRAQAPAAAAPSHAGVTPGGMKWAAAPPALPPGAQAVVLAGDPGKEGIFVIRIKLPAGYRVPPHWHPSDEFVTVLSGTLQFGMGDKFDAASMQTLPAGSFATAAKEMRHYAAAKGPTVIQVTAMGPFAITYVNPADDPRTKTQ